MTHEFACWHGPNYDLYYWKIPCHLFRFSQDITLAKMPGVLFISPRYWKQCSVKQPDAIKFEIYSDSLALVTTEVNKLMHKLWLKVLRMLHLMLIFSLKYVSFETLVCAGDLWTANYEKNQKNPWKNCVLTQIHRHRQNLFVFYFGSYMVGSLSKLLCCVLVTTE